MTFLGMRLFVRLNFCIGQNLDFIYFVQHLHKICKYLQ